MATALDRLPRSLQREETRRKILESATQVFATKGFHNAAVDDIVMVVTRQDHMAG